jgi:hypothetical protein
MKDVRNDHGEWIMEVYIDGVIKWQQVRGPGSGEPETIEIRLSTGEVMVLERSTLQPDRSTGRWAMRGDPDNDNCGGSIIPRAGWTCDCKPPFNKQKAYACMLCEREPPDDWPFAGWDRCE